MQRNVIFKATRILAFAFVFISGSATTSFAQQSTQEAIFAGGCFWCMEADFEKVNGVTEAISGYIGGTGDNPTYKNYSSMGYIEAVSVRFDPAVISYDQLLDLYWTHVDPTDARGQFCDRGHSYTTAIFYLNDEQMRSAHESKQALMNTGRISQNIVTPVIKAGTFTPAEEYHQDYYKKSPIRYKFYRFNCGRDKRLNELWGPKEGQ